ncbi:hypothetical protein VTN77DRAFT_8647 [Rasamsonia byssochlamydoides]|uniref:uncharacterized protein n=1 Tax=Rasamsonia byssochlamydoides TaxID=89139 RepID=UPI0037434024
MSSQGNLGAQSLFEVKDLAAVVTGGGSGIGLMAARTLADNGARVYILGRRLDILERAAEKYSGGNAGGKILPLSGDFTHPEGIRALIAEIAKREPGGINILVNNASVTAEDKARQEAHDIDFTNAEAVSKWMVQDGPEAWRQEYAGNIASHHFFTAAMLPLLNKARQQTHGHSSAIINIASAAGLTKTHSHGQFAYSSTKAAFMHLTKEWAHTFLPLRIRVNCIAPGVFPPIMPEGGLDENQKSRLERVGHEIPAGRPGKESDIGGLILYLSSRAGTYVNGQIIHVDGGILLKTPSTV